MRRRWARWMSLRLAVLMLTGSVAYGMGLPGELPETGGLKLEEETLPETEPRPATDAEESSADETDREALPANPPEADLSSGPEEPEETSWAEGSAEEILQLELDHYESVQSRPLASNAASRSDQNVIVFLRFQDTGEYITGQKVANAEKTFNEDENSLKKIWTGQAVCAQLEASGLSLDTDGDGIIDSISFVIPVYGMGGIENIDHGDLLWSHICVPDGGE